MVFTKNVIDLFIFLGIGTILSSCYAISPTFLRTNNEISINLYQELIESQKENFVFGIFPLDAMVALTYLGIEGDVASEIKSAFAWNVSDDQMKLEFQAALQELTHLSHCDIHVSNRIFASKRLNLNPKFVETASNFDTNIVKVDFGSAKQAMEHINHWASNRTYKKLTNWVDEKHFNAETDLVSVNNIFLRAKWLNGFDKKETTKMDFHVSSNETVKVDMMKISGDFMVARHPTLKIKMVKIPYKNERLYMVILLTDDLENVDHIGRKARENWYDRNFTSEYITIYLPKFEISSTIDMIPTLKNLGITKLFSSKISGITKEPAKLSVVTQKIYFDVNEKGSVADDSPLTEKKAHKKHDDSNEEGKVFHVNQPFVFGICTMISASFSDE
ncbi:hypothetical protein WA026_005655 [Henosepilachna vigintioctopunctata]|uniref:Serpin domain-containing protein n=1 Tax=Henosepilachna vigintioctopunctata TaxID=420089 RepID=A0AAW1U2E6_9CUCU